MDRIKEYRNILKNVLFKYSQLTNRIDSLRNIIIVNEDQNHFLLLNEGWLGKKHIHNCLFHCEIKDDKIWVYFDGFEETITETLMECGIYPHEIVLAFHPPSVRQKTQFTVI